MRDLLLFMIYFAVTALRFMCCFAFMQIPVKRREESEMSGVVIPK